MSFLKIKRQKACQNESNKPNKSPTQVEELQDPAKNNFGKAPTTNPVKLAAEREMSDTEVCSVQIDVQNLHACQICKKTFSEKTSLTSHMGSHKSEAITYACDICRKHFPKLILMQKHRRLHTAEASKGCAVNSGDSLSSNSKDRLDSESSVQNDDQEFYTCQTCQKTFERKSSLTNHMRSHKGEEITYTCDICGKQFAKLIAMQKHRRLHTAASTNPLKSTPEPSNGCPEITDGNLNSSSKDMLDSECSVQIDDQGFYTCQICQKKFDRKSSLTNHVRTHLSPEMTYACDICGKRFARLTTMQQHKGVHTENSQVPLTMPAVNVKNRIKYCGNYEMKVASTKPAAPPRPEPSNECFETSDDNLSWTSEETYTCQICQRSFDKKSSLSNHIRSHNSEDITYPCDICGKRFSQLTTVQHHRRLHTGETPYPCKVCKKRFRTSAALSRHKRTHTGVNIQKCEYCNKEFVYNFAFETHMRIHTGEKPFPCDVCKKTFSQTSALNRHMLIHKAIAPFSCDLCPRKFRQRSEVKVHMRNHTGERPYPCKSCNKGFMQKSHLIAHMKAHLKKERKRKPVTSKAAAVKVKATPEVVLVKEEREEMEELCEEPEWADTPQEPVRVKEEKLEPRSMSKEAHEEFLFEVPVIKQEGSDVPLEATNPERFQNNLPNFNST